MKLWLIRHGSTDMNEAGRYQGRLDGSLSERGRASLRPAELRPERLIVSPAKRARETAAILFPELEQGVVQDLREMDFGEFEGLSWREMEENAAYREWIAGDCLGPCPGGEDRLGFTDRVCGAFLQIVRENAECESVAIVAHGGTQMAILDRWGVPKRAFYAWQLHCGCGYELDWDPQSQTLRVVEEVSFLR